MTLPPTSTVPDHDSPDAKNVAEACGPATKGASRLSLTALAATRRASRGGDDRREAAAFSECSQNGEPSGSTWRLSNAACSPAAPRRARRSRRAGRVSPGAAGRSLRNWTRPKIEIEGERAL